MMALAAGTDDSVLEKAGFFAATSAVRNVASPKGSTVVAALVPVQSSFLNQLRLLLQREIRQNYRDIAALIGRFGVTIFLNLLIGLIFAGAGARDSAHPDGFSAHFGALVMVSIGSMFLSAQPVMLAFPIERPIFLREYTTGTYSCFAYFISKAMVELPLAFLQTLCAYGLIHPLLKLQGDFMQLATSAWGLGIASSSVAVVLGCSVPDVKAVAELAPAVFVPQILFSGFFVRIEQIPVYLRWAQYLCALKYCLNLIFLIEFDDCEKGSNNKVAAKAACDGLFEANDIERSSWRTYIVVLFCLFAGFRLLGAHVLMKKAQSFY
jgi:ABC-type multidrug transport system permease subunit